MRVVVTMVMVAIGYGISDGHGGSGNKMIMDRCSLMSSVLDTVIAVFPGVTNTHSHSFHAFYSVVYINTTEQHKGL